MYFYLTWIPIACYLIYTLTNILNCPAPLISTMAASPAMFWKITLLVCRQMVEINWRKIYTLVALVPLKALMSPATLLVLVLRSQQSASKMETCCDKTLTFLPDRQESASICCPVPVTVYKYPFSWPC